MKPPNPEMDKKQGKFNHNAFPFFPSQPRTQLASSFIVEFSNVPPNQNINTLSALIKEKIGNPSNPSDSPNQSTPPSAPPFRILTFSNSTSAVEFQTGDLALAAVSSLNGFVWHKQKLLVQIIHEPKLPQMSHHNQPNLPDYNPFRHLHPVYLPHYRPYHVPSYPLFSNSGGSTSGFPTSGPFPNSFPNSFPYSFPNSSSFDSSRRSSARSDRDRSRSSLSSGPLSATSFSSTASSLEGQSDVANATASVVNSGAGKVANVANVADVDLSTLGSDAITVYDETGNALLVNLRRVFVGNIPFSTTWPELRDFIISTANEKDPDNGIEIEKVKIPLHRDFSTSSSSAFLPYPYLSTLSSLLHAGEPGSPVPPPPPHYNPFIVPSRDGKSRGFAIVTTKNAQSLESLIKLLNGVSLDDRVLTVRYDHFPR